MRHEPGPGEFNLDLHCVWLLFLWQLDTQRYAYGIPLKMNAVAQASRPVTHAMVRVSRTTTTDDCVLIIIFLLWRGPPGL